MKSENPDKKEQVGRALADVPRAGVWQADVFPLPVPVQDGGKVGFPPTAMVVDEESQFILATKVYPLEADLAHCLGDALLEAMEQHNVIPIEVRVRTKDWAELLAPRAEMIGFRLSAGKKLSVLDSARRAATKMMRRRA